MRKVIKSLVAQFPELRFTASEQFSWSPESGEIFYIESELGDQATWSLLHETGHALLNHASYQSDFELLKLEVAAWGKARELAEGLTIVIDEDHIQDCLDTYRDWLYQRSICPNCTTKCLQQDDRAHYHCFNCHKVWKVSTSRFCRAYRSTKSVTQLAPAFHLTDSL